MDVKVKQLCDHYLCFSHIFSGLRAFLHYLTSMQKYKYTSYLMTIKRNYFPVWLVGVVSSSNISATTFSHYWSIDYLSLNISTIFQAWGCSKSNVREACFVWTLARPLRLCDQENKPLRWVAPHVVTTIRYRNSEQSVSYHSHITRVYELSRRRNVDWCINIWIWSIQVLRSWFCMMWGNFFSTIQIYWYYSDPIFTTELIIDSRSTNKVRVANCREQ